MPRSSHLEQDGFCLGHRTLDRAQAWQLSRSLELDFTPAVEVGALSTCMFDSDSDILDSLCKLLAIGIMIATGQRLRRIQDLD
jgi:hypothetical protein